MVYKIRKIRGKDLYSVKNIESGKIHSVATTKSNAKKQVKLLLAIDHGFVPSSKDLEGAGWGQDMINNISSGLTNLFNRATTRRRRAQVGIEPINDNPNPMGPLFEPVNLTPEIDNSGMRVTPEELFGPRGRGRINPTVQTMVDYLKMLYPAKTLHSVATEILKLTGHKIGSGRRKIKGGKSMSASEIAKYVIGAIGVALAIAVAIFLLNQDKKEDELGSPIKIFNEIYNEPKTERKKIVSVFDNPNSEEYKQRELFKQQSQIPISIPPPREPKPAPKPAPKPIPKIPKGQYEQNKLEVQRTRERLLEIEKRNSKIKADADRAKLMHHLYNE